MNYAVKYVQLKMIGPWLSRLNVYMMLPSVVITDFTGLILKYFAYFLTDKDTRLNLFSQNSRCRGRFIANEACTSRE